MVRKAFLAANLLAVASPAYANDWEKFYSANPELGDLLPSTVEPELLQGQGDFDRDVDTMWRKGFGLIGYTSFNASNTKTADGLKLAKKLKARYVVVGTNYTGTNTGAIPITTPTTSATYSNGTASASGGGSYASGTYSGTATTYGSQTTLMPFSVNRYDKYGLYFRQAPKTGVGVLFRELTTEEVARLETRRAVAVLSIWDGSPSYEAGLLPGDIVTFVNNISADPSAWRAAVHGPAEVALKFVRNGTTRDVLIPIPPEWRH